MELKGSSLHSQKPNTYSYSDQIDPVFANIILLIL